MSQNNGHQQSQKTAIIMAGGTGGHIFPGLAVAEELKQQGLQVQWLGTEDRMEAQLIPKFAIPIHFIRIKGIRGRGIMALLTAPLMILMAWLQARKSIKTLKPNIVIGFGGYVSGPGGIAAWSLGVPLVIHEQNAILGTTNKWLAKIADMTLLAFDHAMQAFKNQSRKKRALVKVVGNPVRDEICGLNHQGKRRLTSNMEFRLLILGGSLGSRPLNQTLPAIFTELMKQDFQLSVQHQVGKNNADSVQSEYKTCLANTKLESKLTSIKVTEFIDDMQTALAWADLVICRSGALTVSEVAASGNVGVFVPLPHAIDDHQTFNAMSLVERGAASIVPQAEMPDKIQQTLTELLSRPEQINQMQVLAAQQASLSATKNIVAVCKELELNY